MARMIAEVYDALRSAGADDAKARAAAIALADSDRRFEDVGAEIRGSERRLDHRVTEVEQSLDHRITEVERRITGVEHGLGHPTEHVGHSLQKQLARIERRFTRLNWNLRLNTALLIAVFVFS